MSSVILAQRATSREFSAVTGLTTDAISLVTEGDLLVIASVNSQSSGGAAGGEWQLQMKQGAEGTFNGVGSSITRSLSGTDDRGIITLIDVVEDQTAADYYFQLAHKATSGTIQTLNTSLVAVSLGYLKQGLEARRFNCDKSTVASTGTTSTSAVIATTFNTAAQGTKVLLVAQYGMSATVASTASYVVSCTGQTTESSFLQRYLANDSDNGAGGIVGLVTGLTGAKDSYDFNLLHYTNTGTLTTNNIIFGAIQLTDVFAETLPVELSAFTGQFINSVPTLYWSTQTETDNLGWNVYRNKENDFTSAERVNTELIPGHGTTAQPQDYIFTDETGTFVPGENYWYWLESIDYSGTVNHYDRVALIHISEIENPNPNSSVPRKYGLQSGPNPFNSNLEISYMLHETDMVRVEIYNMIGQLVAQFNEGVKTADQPYTLDWNGKDMYGQDVGTGVLLIKLITSQGSETTKAILLR